MSARAETERVPRRAWIVLAILICFYLISFLDKQMYALLLNLMGKGLHLSDFELGTVQGVAFSGFYTFGVLVMGWAVDRFSIRLMLLAGVVFWSLCAAASGLAHNFPQLFAARAGVGLGEAVLLPAAMSLLAYVFPRRRLSFATGIFFAGANMGGLVALLFGGNLIQALVALGPTTWPLLGELAPWQAAFLMTGLPSVLVALLALLLPRRGSAGRDHDRAASAGEAGFLPFVRAHKVFVAGLVCANALLTMLAYTIIVWTAAHFERHFGWKHGKIGEVMALGMLAGGFGNVFWGWLADRIRRQGRRDALLLLYIGVTLIGVPFGALTFLTDNPTLAIVGYPLCWLLMNSFGPMTSAIQFGVPDRLRGRLISLGTMAGGLVGLGGAPMIVGAITDFVYRDPAKLGHSMVVTITGAALLAVLILVLTRRAYVAAVAEQEASDLAAPASRSETATEPEAWRARPGAAATP